jgi:hypothetical protein
MMATAINFTEDLSMAKRAEMNSPNMSAMAATEPVLVIKSSDQANRKLTAFPYASLKKT